MTAEKIKTIDGQKLLEMELPPIRFIIDELLPQGFYILAGSPKIGKSWLLLLLCLQVAKGEPFWNRSTEKGTVLYLCLEDSPSRIQQRLSELTEDAPPNLKFATSVNSLSNGLVGQMEMFITENPDTNLIVIDTLQKVRENGNESNLYASDYRDIGALKELADKYGITIIAVQHLRKQLCSDPHQMVSGSTGLLGAADGSYILKKDNIGDETAKLYIRTRDIEEKIYTVKFDKELHEWKFVSSDTPETNRLQNDTVMNSFILFMKQTGKFTGTAGELVQRIGCAVSPNVFSRRLNGHRSELKKIGIEFKDIRTGTSREKIIVYRPHQNVQ